MDPIKDSFQRIKKDIVYLNGEINLIKSDINGLREEMENLCILFEKLSKKFNLFYENKKTSEISEEKIQTNNQKNQTHSEHIPTHKIMVKDLKPINLTFSIGNHGVQTNRQTDKQTNRQTDKQTENEEFQKDPIKDASEILDSLDSLKREIRLKFKRLTDQETLVFSTIYQLEEEKGETDYRAVAVKLGLTESSIRDYVRRLINKGIPVEKNRINNKNIQLSISKDLKKIATLHTILRLRDI